MKIPTWLRWTAVTFSAFLAGVYVAYAAGIVKPREMLYSTKAAPVQVVPSEAAVSAEADPDVMFSSSKFAPVFSPSSSEPPAATPTQEQPPQTWMYSSKSAPISPPTTSKTAPPAEREFMMGSKSAAVITDVPAPPPAPAPQPPAENHSKPSPPSKGKGAYHGKGGPW